MKLRAITLFAVSAALVAGSLSANAAPRSHSRNISKAQAIKIAKRHVGGGRVTDTDHSDGRWEIEIRKGCTEYDIDISSRSGRVVNVDKENRCDD